MKKLYLYPIWLRVWHWMNAILFIILIITGVSLHFADASPWLMSFETARLLHNLSGIVLSLLLVIYTVMNIVSHNYKYYMIHTGGLFRNMMKQAKYYLFGVFRGDPHPFHVNEKEKFNPLQKISYFFIMFFFMPFIIVSGWLLMFPELAPEEILGMGGVWPMAIGHIVVGYFLSLFMFAHIYLATHGETFYSNFKSMVNGYHEAEEEHDTEKKTADVQEA